MKYIIAIVAITFLLVAIYTWREARRMRRQNETNDEAYRRRGVHTGSDHHKED